MKKDRHITNEIIYEVFFTQCRQAVIGKQTSTISYVNCYQEKIMLVLHITVLFYRRKKNSMM